jgi:site-specific DNA recombinase
VIDPRIALYCRVSSDEQAEKDTIKAQLTFLRERARLYDYPIVGEYIDDPASGLTPLSERPGGSQLLRDAQGGMFGTVAITKVDRMSRSLWILLDGHRRWCDPQERHRAD